MKPQTKYQQCRKDCMDAFQRLLKQHNIQDGMITVMLDSMRQEVVSVREHEEEFEWRRRQGFSTRLIKQVQRESDIVEVLKQWLPLKKNGFNWACSCPFHSERGTGFNVNPLRQIYWCGGCKATGDVFNFVMEHKKLSFPEAFKLLTKRAGIPLQ